MTHGDVLLLLLSLTVIISVALDDVGEAVSSIVMGDEGVNVV